MRAAKCDVIAFAHVHVTATPWLFMGVPASARVKFTTAVYRQYRETHPQFWTGYSSPLIGWFLSFSSFSFFIFILKYNISSESQLAGWLGLRCVELVQRQTTKWPQLRLNTHNIRENSNCKNCSCDCVYNWVYNYCGTQYSIKHAVPDNHHDSAAWGREKADLKQKNSTKCYTARYASFQWLYNLRLRRWRCRILSLLTDDSLPAAAATAAEINQHITYKLWIKT